MPSTRLTVALNSNQTLKTPLLVPNSALTDPTQANSIRALVFKTAQSKLRIKKPTRVFLAGSGEELTAEEDWKRCCAGQGDITLLVSKGEEYVGLKREIRNSDPTTTIPIHNLGQLTPIDPLALTQLHTTAHTLPGIVHATGQPDLHPGTKHPIGAVFISRGWIHPPLIGSDIGCGMAWFRTRLGAAQVEGERGRKVAGMLRGLEGRWRGEWERKVWLEDGESGESCGAGKEWDVAVGTIGAGNHFAEIQVVEEVEEVEGGLRGGEVVLLVHSGSRGYGGSILKKYTSGGQVSLQEGTTEAEQYVEEHDRACRWAKANRDLIALRFLNCLEPGEPAWRIGQNDSDDVSAEDIHAAQAELAQRRVVDIWHNNVERVLWPPVPPPGSSDIINKDESDGAFTSIASATPSFHFIHRKGAAPTYHPQTALPLSTVPLPGSRGTPTLILSPLFSASTLWGQSNALSLAHGAGRSMSRAKALSSLSHKYTARSLLEPKGADGTWVVCDEKDLVFEEAPEAYKDVEVVGADLVRAGAAQRLGWCRARVSYKVRDEKR